jgi:hypothetical protein
MSVCDQFPPPFTSRRRVAAGMTTGVTTSDNKIRIGVKKALRSGLLSVFK